MVIWDVTFCSLVGVYHCFKGTCYHYLQNRRVTILRVLLFFPGHGGKTSSEMLVPTYLPDYAVSRPK